MTPSRYTTTQPTIESRRKTFFQLMETGPKLQNCLLLEIDKKISALRDRSLTPIYDRGRRPHLVRFDLQSSVNKEVQSI